MAYNVLIVDDSSVLRKVIIRTINMSGFDVGEIYQAENGADALEKLEANWVDLILADINMPVMNGVELLKRVKAHETLGSIPFLVISSDGAESRVQEMMDLGAKDYLKKPFKPEQLKQLLENYL